MRMRLLLISEAVIYIQSQANHAETANKNTACMLLCRRGHTCLFTQSLSSFCVTVVNVNERLKRKCLCFLKSIQQGCTAMQEAVQQREKTGYISSKQMYLRHLVVI